MEYLAINWNGPPITPRVAAVQSRKGVIFEIEKITAITKNDETWGSIIEVMTMDDDDNRDQIIMLPIKDDIGGCQWAAVDGRERIKNSQRKVICQGSR